MLSGFVLLAIWHVVVGRLGGRCEEVIFSQPTPAMSTYMPFSPDASSSCSPFHIALHTLLTLRVSCSPCFVPPASLVVLLFVGILFDSFIALLVASPVVRGCVIRCRSICFTTLYEWTTGTPAQAGLERASVSSFVVCTFYAPLPLLAFLLLIILSFLCYAWLYVEYQTEEILNIPIM